MSKTEIEWATDTWNPTTGCDRVSPGCDNCYALGMAKRLKAMGSADYQTDGDPATSGPGFGLAMHEHRIDQPRRWKKPRLIFVNSMSDLFHQDVTDEFLRRVFDVMEQADHHTYQILTKRHARMRSFVQRRMDAKRAYADQFADCPTEAMRTSPAAKWARAAAENPPAHIWLGVSIEDQKWADIRGEALRQTPAAVRFFSAEPLLGPIVTDLTGIDWVIVGGESGPKARPMHPDWARSLRDQCQAAGVPLLFKQWGEWQDGSHDPRTQHGPDHIIHRDGRHVLAHEYQGSDLARGRSEDRIGACFISRVGKKAAGRLLDGRIWDEYPREVTA
jgi:protein gp37